MKINIDLNGKYVRTNRSWQFGIGNDHAFQLLRKDVLEHLKLAHDKLGFKYVRFHGLFDDDMQVIQTLAGINSALPFADRIKEISFKQIANVFDSLAEIGLKPFVELSFMPEALASGEKTGLAYGNNITMPKSLDEWAEFIKLFTEFLIKRYGKDEVRTWYFEVWNEPDLPIFFDGTQSDYFKLYKATATAIKSVDNSLKVGGPSTSACKWLKEFKDYCTDNSLPCDFISTHHYPGDGFVSLPDDGASVMLADTLKNCAENGVDLGDAVTAVCYNSKTYKAWKKGVFAQMDKNAKEIAGDLPLFITEWNSMATYSAPVHDEKYSAAFVIKSVMDLKTDVGGYMFWCCSDIFEEICNFNKPFHGSFGIVNNDGIPKPNFWAFYLLSKLYDEQLDLPVTNNDVEYAVFKSGNKTQILLYAQNFDPQSVTEYEIGLNVNMRCNCAKITRIDDTNCNPKKIWKTLGSPSLLTKEQVRLIITGSKPVKKSQKFSIDGNSTILKLKMKSNDVLLIELE